MPPIFPEIATGNDGRCLSPLQGLQARIFCILVSRSSLLRFLPLAAHRPIPASSCRSTFDRDIFRAIVTRFDGRRDPPPVSRTQERAAPTVINCSHSGGFEQFMLRRSGLEKPRNASRSPESIAHRGSSDCGSAVGRVIHTARFSLRKSVRIPFLAYQIRLTSSEKCRKRKANSDSKYCEDMPAETSHFQTV